MHKLNTKQQQAKETAILSMLEQAKEITKIAKRLNDDTGFSKALNIISTPKSALSRVIVSGIGKSGHVGCKIAATLSSTGTTSFFVHSTEAFHGDLGMITPEDTIILISNSGETDEVIKLIPTFKMWGNRIVSICGNKESTLAKHSDANIDISIAKEACPINLAPTTSTTATIVVGDAIACALITHQNFQPQDFAKYHPGGSLGKRLLSTIKGYQKQQHELAIISKTTKYIDIILAMTEKRTGVALVMDESKKKLLGVISDGDLRREQAQSAGANSPFDPNIEAGTIMSKDPVSVKGDTSLVEATEIMKNKRIKQLVIIDDNGDFVSIVEQHDVV